METTATILGELALGAFTTATLGGLKRLGEEIIKKRYDGVYDGAEDFWYRGVEQESIADGSKVKITGLLSPLAPFMPSHPRAKPGYSVEGWDAMSARLKSLIRKRGHKPPADPLCDYDEMDNFVWGDVVVRPPLLAGKKVYAGLYNRYGKSYECLPVFLNGQDKTVKRLELNRNYGHLVDVTGIVRKMPSFYESLGMVRLIDSRYPCYCVDVSKINVQPAAKLVLYATAWALMENGQIAT
jgi:hypothetical protein